MPPRVTCDVCATVIANIYFLRYCIVMDGLVLRIVMHNRGLGNPVMGMLRLAPAIAVRATGTAA